PIVRGEGVNLIAENGDSYLDAVSSWWVNIHGHSNKHIAEKVAEQLHCLEHVIFAGFTHPQAVILAERLLRILPEGQEKIFYSDNGSTAVEVSLKMSLQYWSNIGKPRKRVMAFKNAYHGDTFGAMAVSGKSVFNAVFDDLLFDVHFIDLPEAENLDALIREVKESGQEIACFIYEPLVQGSAGMLMYDATHMNHLLAACREQGILLIADEVMTGFGRTGTLFASDHINTKPDLTCLSKGLTGGFLPMGITSCTPAIYNAFLSADKSKTLYHGHSYTANPITCAAANASLDLLLDQTCEAARSMIAKRHTQFKEHIKDHPRVASVRQTGTILAIEWKVSSSGYTSPIRDLLYNFFMERHIILRPLGHIIYILPPYVITEAELDRIYAAIEEALAQIG
ncbi:MAG: adenosylmethionine--8-amino-7-oxononanoate transaminase, partial [Sphingobacteriales bacterium]